MNHRIFLHGPLRDGDLLQRVVGTKVGTAPALLPDHFTVWSASLRFAHIHARAGLTAEGLVAHVDDVALEALRFYCGVFGGTLHPVTLDGGDALACMTNSGVLPTADDGHWNFSEWQQHLGPAERETAEEVMRLRDTHPPEGIGAILVQIRMRASSRVRARTFPTPDHMTPRMAIGDLDIEETRQPYTDYFAVREDVLRFPNFGGGMSASVTRATFLGGDAVTVLPYDPVSDSVLVIRQFRHGVFARGDTQPWLIEPAAGRIDPFEDPETTALRELREETGIDGGELHLVAQYYPSPSAYSEYIFSYVAVTDLSGRDGTTSGLDSEDEDIMSHVLPFSHLMDLVETGMANTAPLVLSAFWLMRHRERLRRAD